VNRSASCCCGQSTIEVEGDPKLHRVCSCNDCKKSSGSAFGISAYFADSQVKNKNAETRSYHITNKETEQQRYFCRSCGTTLYWKISRFPSIPGIAEMTGIAGGCFTDNPLPFPTLSAATVNKCAWLELPELQVVS